MRPKVYVETSVISYLTARPSRDLITAAHQQITRDWWEKHRSVYDLFVSELVILEAGRGDMEAARQRKDTLITLPILATTPQALSVGADLVAAGAISAQAQADAMHVAIAAAHGMRYLLTWNCRHLANVRVRTRTESRIRALGLEPPALCTPEELMGD